MLNEGQCENPRTISIKAKSYIINSIKNKNKQTNGTLNQHS